MTRPTHTASVLMLLVSIVLAAPGCTGAQERRLQPGDARPAVVQRLTPDPAVAFAAEDVRAALCEAGHPASVRGLDAPLPAGAISVTLALGAPADLGPQGFAIERTGDAVTVRGTDAAGAMYGGLDVAETIRLAGWAAVGPKTARPAVLRRGVKFNIPLDARTPSYDDSGDAAQTNIATMWEWDFWRDYIDAMARARYNVLSLWNPHPFPSMVRLEKYPDVALEDVCVSKIKPEARHGSIGEHMGVTKEVLANVEAVRRLSMDEKIAFWRRVMAHARDRGIEVYFITWNVLTNSAGGKYGIDDRQDNPATIAYVRDCVRQFILTYPDLAGIGVTAGERMQDRKDEFAKEKWLWRAYGEGVLDAKRADPKREVRFIHRIWQTSVKDVMDEWKAYPDAFELSFKYARARLYSSPRPPFAKALLEEMKPYDLKCWWNLRNDDIFVFRWGDPDYVREFLSALPAGQTAGYYVGSDGYAWGREFASLEPDSPRQLEVEKHWYNFMLWGRLGYDPGLDRAHFEKMLERRLPIAPAARLYEAWQAASKIIPLVNRFHWRNWDYMWAVEGCFDQKGFHTVRDFVGNETMEASGLVSAKAWAAARAAGRTVEGTPPEAVADELDRLAAAAMNGLADLRTQFGPKPAKELRQTLDDIEAMAHLGRYYAAKIRGAADLAMLDATKDEAHRASAVRRLEEAVTHWQAYAAAATRNYRPQLLARTRDLDWNRLLEDVKRDVALARSADAKN